MDKTRIKIFGKKLRQTYLAPDELPFPMRKTLETLSHRPATADNDELPHTRSGTGRSPISTNVTLARNSD